MDAQLLSAVEAATGQLLNEFHCESGVRLRTLKVKTTIVRRAWAMLNEPKPPMIYIDELKRYEENPNDPHYIEAMSNYTTARADATVNVYLMLGTEVKFVPEGMYGPNDEEWTQELKELNMDIPPVGTKLRKVAWLQYYVLDDLVEIAELQKQIMRQSGLVLQADVEEAVDSFQDQ